MKSAAEAPAVGILKREQKQKNNQEIGMKTEKKKGELKKKKFTVRKS